MSIKMTIPRAVWDKLQAGEELTKEDMNSVTHETACSVCGEAVDTTNEVGDNDASEEELLAAEVIGHGTGSLEMGCCGVRHYHAKCYWKEMEEIDAAEEAALLSKEMTVQVLSNDGEEAVVLHRASGREFRTKRATYPNMTREDFLAHLSVGAWVLSAPIEIRKEA